jgi:hypothetical protein
LYFRLLKSKVQINRNAETDTFITAFNGHKKYISFFCYFLLLIISAAITPGTQPQSVSKNTIMNDPQPLSTMAKGGKIIQRITRQMDITIDF